MPESSPPGKWVWRAAATPLTVREFVLPLCTVITVYSSVLVGLHFRQTLAKEAGTATHQPGNYWGTLPSAWDHPEPNYLVSEVIGEFWSVLTTIPIAGTLLMYQGLKYSYGGKALRIYALTCIMYTLAFSAHLTLQKLVFSTTVTSVMSNALLTFAQFSSVVHRWLKSGMLRATIVFCAEVALISTVATLPYRIANGGVWTLFAVQSPGVFLAAGIAGLLLRSSKTTEEQQTYRTVFGAGCLLSTAMVLSLVECLTGFEYGFMLSLWGFPWLHIAIHIFEQVGIYYFGVGTAALQELLFEEEVREGAEVRYVLGFPYLYCPHPRELAGPGPSLVALPTTKVTNGNAKDTHGDAIKHSADAATSPMPAAEVKKPLGQKRSRIASPGPPVVRKGA